MVRPAGADVLDAVDAFLARFVSYPSEHARTAHTLWAAHAWLLDVWESTPRIAFLSPEPGSGKTRALEATEPLVPRAVHAVNTTPAYLFRRVSDRDGRPTILYDEIDTIFGPRAKDNEDIRGMLNAGHRRAGTAGRCVVRGQLVMTEDLPAYCAVALAGLDDLPDTLHSRSVIIRMQPRTAAERVESWRHRVHGPQGAEIAAELEQWTDALRAEVAEAGPIWPIMPAGVEDRAADLWEPLLYVADHAGADWPERARAAAVVLVADAANRRPSLGLQLLANIRDICRAKYAGQTAIFTTDLVRELNAMEDAPWGDLHGKPLDPRGLARRLINYRVGPDTQALASTTIRLGLQRLKGYWIADLEEVWSRYLPGPSHTSVTSVTPVTPRSPEAEFVTDVTANGTDVTDVTDV